MARKSKYRQDEKGAEISDLLDSVEKLINRTKVLYEQYFMGIQKTAPMQLHRDIERKIRELTQMHIRNTALRYRLTNITQKFGVYNTYWRRIMRQIEQGRYVRDIARVSRRAQRRGEDVPDELLAAMPKRMRDRIRRDREALAKQAGRRSGGDAADGGAGEVREQRSHVHEIDDGLLGGGEIGADLDDLFAALTSEAEKAVDAHTRPAPEPAAKPAPAAVTPPPRPAPPPTPAATAKAASTGPRVGAAKPPAGQPLGRPATAKPPVRPAVPGPPARPGAARPAPRPAGAKPRPPTARPGPRGPAPQRANPARSGALPPGMTEAKTRDLYKRYIQARRLVGESTNIPYDKLVKSLSQRAPKIMQKHEAKAVEFDVVVKGDKVLLKAKPK